MKLEKLTKDVVCSHPPICASGSKSFNGFPLPGDTLLSFAVEGTETSQEEWFPVLSLVFTNQVLGGYFLFFIHCPTCVVSPAFSVPGPSSL